MAHVLANTPRRITAGVTVTLTDAIVKPGGRSRVYFIIRNRTDNKFAGLTPRERKVATDAYDQAQSMSLQEAAAARRKHFAPKRLPEVAAEKGGGGGGALGPGE